MKKKYFVIGVILSVLLPINVKALSGSVSISCNNSSIEVGSNTTCTISGYSDSEISALSASLTSSGSISISNINTSSIWQGNGGDGNIQLYTDSNKSGGFSIATFTITGNSIGSGNINLNSVKFTDASFSEDSISGSSITITVKEKYVPKPDPTPSNPGNTSSNNQTTVTTNPSTPEATKSNDASLKNITISNVNFEFSKDKLEYDIEVSNSIEKIEINAEANNDKAKVTIPSDLSLKLGNNTFIIEVEAEDGTKKEYKINIKRLERVLSSNTNLSKLEIKGYNIKFNKDKYIYDIGNIKSNKLNITATSEDKLSKISIYGNNNIGKNDVIVIKVTAEDNTTKEYLIYANNTSNNSIKDILLITFLVLLISSVVVNFVLIFKQRRTIAVQ